MNEKLNEIISYANKNKENNGKINEPNYFNLYMNLNYENLTFNANYKFI